MVKLIKGFKRDYDPVTHHGKVIGFVYRPIKEIVYRNYWATSPNGWHSKSAQIKGDSTETPNHFLDWIGEWKHYTKLN